MQSAALDVEYFCMSSSAGGCKGSAEQEYGDIAVSGSSRPALPIETSIDTG